MMILFTDRYRSFFMRVISKALVGSVADPRPDPVGSGLFRSLGAGSGKKLLLNIN